MNVTVIFDGQCGVCTAIIRKLHNMDKRSVLTFQPCQTLPIDGRHGITYKKCMKELWAIADDGTIAAGSDAVALVLTAVWSNRWPYRIGRWPIIRPILSFGYRYVAENRRKFPGEKPWCQQHPEDCNHRQPTEGIVL